VGSAEHDQVFASTAVELLVEAEGEPLQEPPDLRRMVRVVWGDKQMGVERLPAKRADS